VLTGFARVLRPGAPLLTAFQVGDGCVHLQQGYGHEISLHAWRRDPDGVGRLLAHAGLEVRVRVVREPEPPRERTRQAYPLAVRAAVPTSTPAERSRG
jgi:hypothetical protein